MRGDSASFDGYLVADEPAAREKAYAWSTAIGLQQVDGLSPSKYLIKTARRHIEGEITQAEARKLVDDYYETKEGHDLPDDVKEADKVAARMVAIINSPTFNFSVPYYLGLHRQIFEGVFPFAGEIRSVELTKTEWVLNNEDTVQYTPSSMVKDTLEYEFEREKKFRYKGLSEDAFVSHFAAFIASVWQIHPFREGNTRTVGLFAIKYLRSRGYAVTNDLFASKSWYFRNALVRANYENDRRGVEKTLLPLEEFFKVLLFEAEIELRNRFLHVDYDYGSAAANALAPMRRGMSKAAGNSGLNSGLKSGLKNEKAILSLVRGNSKVTIAEMVESTGLSRNGVKKIIARLKASGCLCRVGPDKGGHWEVLRGVRRGGEGSKLIEIVALI